MVLCDIFSKETKSTHHIKCTFQFRCCFGFGKNNKSDRSEKAHRLPLFLNCPRHILDHLWLVSLKFNCGEAILASLQECWNWRKTSNNNDRFSLKKKRFAAGAHSCRLRKNWFCSALLLKDFRNLVPVPSCKGTLVAKGKELDSKLGLSSVERKYSLSGKKTNQDLT